MGWDGAGGMGGVTNGIWDGRRGMENDGGWGREGMGWEGL